MDSSQFSNPLSGFDTIEPLEGTGATCAAFRVKGLRQAPFPETSETAVRWRHPLSGSPAQRVRDWLSSGASQSRQIHFPL